MHIYMNKSQSYIALSGLAIAFGLLLAPAASYAASGDIVDKAVNTPSLSTLVTLVTQANLVSALHEAFDRLPQIIKDAIQRDPSVLPTILTYHVINGSLTSADIPKFARVKTLEGSKVTARKNHGEVFINNAKVVAADVLATNGVVHVIDTVLIPPTVIKAEIDRLRAQIEQLRDLRNGQHND
jgi:uncharacterized surface protein with fasciclin (FAS1) repeats